MSADSYDPRPFPTQSSLDAETPFQALRLVAQRAGLELAVLADGGYRLSCAWAGLSVCDLAAVEVVLRGALA